MGPGCGAGCVTGVVLSNKPSPVLAVGAGALGYSNSSAMLGSYFCCGGGGAALTCCCLAGFFLDGLDTPLAFFLRDIFLGCSSSLSSDSSSLSSDSSSEDSLARTSITRRTSTAALDPTTSNPAATTITAALGTTPTRRTPSSAAQSQSQRRRKRRRGSHPAQRKRRVIPTKSQMRAMKSSPRRYHVRRKPKECPSHPRRSQPNNSKSGRRLLHHNRSRNKASPSCLNSRVLLHLQPALVLACSTTRLQ